MSELAALAPYACHAAQSRGRLFPEPESPNRSCFQRDRDRIIHSGAFRRLKYKTQVFVYHEGDYYRTRLTHSIEVAQIARSVSRQLGLNEDLAEALALAHDLGHTPFGHAGEHALDNAMKGHGGFDHNEQTFRILTQLEKRYAEFDGLNLTWETLEGTVKHNGPLLSEGVGEGRPSGQLRPSIAAYCERFDLMPASYPSAEAQVAALADDIAYNSHDLDDGLRAGLFELDDLAEVPLTGPLLSGVLERYPGLDKGRVIHETIRRVIDAMVRDLLEETRRRLANADPRDPEDIRSLGRPLVSFSPAMTAQDRGLKEFLFRHMYRHYRVSRMASKVGPVVADLFAFYLSRPDCLPPEWQGEQAGAPESGRVRVVADYIAGMTDRFALAEHQKLFDVYAEI